MEASFMIWFGSVCSGIEAASAAWLPLGWSCRFMSEIDAFPRAVLSHHYPEVPLHGDFTTVQADQYGPIDVLVGGTPCQSFSVAGLRGGVEDARGNLALEYLRLADRLRPRWLVWENVPGVRSSNDGRDFGAFLGGLGQLGYGWAYRSLDAQYLGLAQRRERVFVVGYLGDWRRAAAVLFEPASLRGDTPPSREARKDVAETLGARTGNSVGAQDAAADHMVAMCLNAKGAAGRIDAESETFITHTLRADGSAVRRLTPRECCRLQGFPDDYLNIEYRGKPAADGPKYKALGNSMAVPVMRWIGRRIAAVS
jgi:DNA (cytosine-5)-methyltransferase 1